MTAIVKNTVQVYGLPRSGTNFVEWALINNFYHIQYANYDCYDFNPIIPRKKWAIKHSLEPNFYYSDNLIIIFKPIEEYLISYKKWNTNKYDENVVKSTYNSYMKYVNNLYENYKNNVLLINYNDAYNFYEKFITDINYKFKLHIKEKIIKPENRLDKGGAKVRQTSRKFKK